MWTRQFWKDTAERVIATFCQALAAALLVLPVVDALPAVDVFTVGWKQALGLATGAALLSLLKCLAARKTGDPESASLVETGDDGPAGRYD